MTDFRKSLSTGWVNDKGFVGGTIQESTGLTTLGAREYDADTGRFISADPVINYNNPQQINGYAYGNNNPVANADPSGMCADIDCPTRPCPLCENTTPGHEPGPPRVSANAAAAGVTLEEAIGQDSAAAVQKRAAQAEVDAAKQRAIAVAKELGQIIADELGITDALDCFTTGSLGSCGATALNVVTSLISGGPLGRLASKYLFRVDKAYALIKLRHRPGPGPVGRLPGLAKEHESCGRARLVQQLHARNPSADGRRLDQEDRGRRHRRQGPRHRPGDRGDRDRVGHGRDQGQRAQAPCEGHR
jgi:RHS repeat-associated protein